MSKDIITAPAGNADTLSTPAIVLRRVAYGDNDWIVSLLTLTQGKLAVMAKSAKKSVKRFGGILELFSVLDVVCDTGPRRRLPLLREAVLTLPYAHIRADITKTAYASYWGEILNTWMMEGKPESELYHLFQWALTSLDTGAAPIDVLSVVFQLKFLSASGLAVPTERCGGCGLGIDAVSYPRLGFDARRGRLLCRHCGGDAPGLLPLSKGTLKLLFWVGTQSLSHIHRVRFTAASETESTRLLEALISIHMGRKLNSLQFLHNLKHTTGDNP